MRPAKIHLMTGAGDFTCCGFAVSGTIPGTRDHEAVTCKKCLLSVPIFATGKTYTYQEVEHPLQAALAMLEEAGKVSQYLGRGLCTRNISGAQTKIRKALYWARVRSDRYRGTK